MFDFYTQNRELSSNIRSHSLVAVCCALRQLAHHPVSRTLSRLSAPCPPGLACQCADTLLTRAHLRPRAYTPMRPFPLPPVLGYSLI